MPRETIMAARRRTGHSQGELFLAEPVWPPQAPLLASGTPDLAFYDLIVANISGGKDSQTMLRVLVTAAIAAGIPLSRIVCVFADLGEADEWPGTAEIAAEHAARYGLRFITVRRQDRDGRPQGLLEHIWEHGQWPDGRNRFCTVNCTNPASLIMSWSSRGQGGVCGSSSSADGGPGRDPAYRVGGRDRPVLSAVRGARRQRCRGRAG
jgi:hypothetical protein